MAAPDTRFAEDTLPLLSSIVGATFDDAGADKDGGEASMPLRTPLDGNASLISSDKAAARLGWAPRSWQKPVKSDSDPTGPLLPYGLGSRAAQRALSDSDLSHYDLSDFLLDDGARLPAGATLAYKVHGQPIGSGAGVILHPTSFDAVHDELQYNIGPGLTLDTDKYTCEKTVDV